MNDVFWLVDGGSRSATDDDVITVRSVFSWREARAWYEAGVDDRFVEVFDSDGKVLLDYERGHPALSFEMSAPKVPGLYRWNEFQGHVPL